MSEISKKKINKHELEFKKNPHSIQQTEQQRLQNEKLFEMGYKDLLRHNPFWLEGKTLQQIMPMMKKYVVDFHNAYQSFPAWYIDPESNLLKNLDEINSQNFRIAMKFIHKTNQ